ncbi:unnamed protein product [Microthlaspi erraticum]|uniref:Uncharacterized protein n=1 Tax=Microthlaspi erraticum TaxID=1685480 RepID=A0A6D2JNL3_9BRAS|nr:unnamed protein product [Microthlaspi erraticum]
MTMAPSIGPFSKLLGSCLIGPFKMTISSLILSSWNEWLHPIGSFLKLLDHSYHLQVAGVVIPLLHPPLSFRGGFLTFPLPEGFVPVVLEN